MSCRTIIYFIEQDEPKYLVGQDENDKYFLETKAYNSKVRIDELYKQQLSYNESKEYVEYQIGEVSKNQIDIFEDDAKDYYWYNLGQIYGLGIDTLDWLALSAADTYIKEEIRALDS